ncbi:MAG TPA: outer membrane beta-barrel protein [Pedobacter sp.]|nr:outer membrane beta-barrel protein [Pedobacter sp.]
MKKYLFIVLAAGIGLSAHAQVSFQKIIKIGVKAGITGSVFTKDVAPFDPHIPGYYDTFENFARLSGFGGITFDYEVTQRLSVGAELLYTARGMAYREENNDVIIYNENGEEQAYNYFNFAIDYMELPVTLNYNVLPLQSNTWLKVYAGFARGAAVRKKTRLSYPDVDDDYYERPDAVKQELKYVKTYISSVIGGLKVGGRKTKGISPFGDLRGSYTLDPVFNRSKAANGGNLDTRMFTLSLGLGVQF